MDPEDLGIDDPRRMDLLRQVREVCRLHWAKRGHEDVDAKSYETGSRDERLTYIRVSYVDDNFPEHALVGVHDGTVDPLVVMRFSNLFAEHREVRSTPDLIYRGKPPTPRAEYMANEHQIRLRSFDSYERALWNHARYLKKQTEELINDPLYPLNQHVDKRWSLLGKADREAGAADRISQWLDTDGPRFVLVLGNSGTGKTFLIRVLARDLAASPDRVPVLVTMRDLEKRRTLEELVALHMARTRPHDAFHYPSFQYLLRQGRIVLLFDGFDELAQRPTYDRVKQHFDTLRQAADGAAKIVVTSRHEHFATDTDVLNELGLDARALPGARIIRLYPLDEHQRRDLVEQTIDPAEAAAFLRDLESVPNLPELAANPRMLTFMMARRDSLARLAGSASATEPMTAGRLYEILLNDWLVHELNRQIAPGAADPLTIEQRCAALRQLAVLLWRSGRASVPLTELGELAESISELAAWQVQAGEAAHAVGSATVLVRAKGDQFAFIHQSVLEWFVADTIRVAFTNTERDDVGALLADHDLSAVMADFLCDLAGDQPVAWAREAVRLPDEPGPKTKANATLILQRVATRASGSAEFVADNLAGQDLRGRDLSRADLSGANLSGAQLDGAVLPRTLAGANLQGAHLAGARLDNADLAGANLAGANLQGARLLGANLTGANLDGTNLDRAILIGATVAPESLATASTFGAALPADTPTPQHAGNAFVYSGILLKGSLLAIGHGDGTVRITDAVSGSVLRTLAGHAGDVTALAAPASASWLASGGEDGVVRIWDPSTGARLRDFDRHNDSVRALAAAPDGAWLASAGSDLSVWIWDPATGTRLRTLEGHTSAVRALAVDPAGRWLASAGYDDSVRIWDPATGTQLHALEGHTSAVRALAVDPAGEWLASAAGDGTVRIWDPATGAHRHTLTGHNGQVSALAVSPDGTWLASSGVDHSVRIWEPIAGSNLRTFDIKTGWVLALVAGPDGAWLASGGYEFAVRISDPSTGVQLRTVARYGRSVNGLAVDHRGGWLASAVDDGMVRIWNPNGEGEYLQSLGSRGRSEFAVAVDPGGRWVASAGADGTVRIWDPGTGKHLHALEGHTLWVRTLVADPAGVWLASGGDDRTVRIWDPTAGTHLHTLHGLEETVETLAVGPRGEWLAAAGRDDVVRIWDPTTGKQLRDIPIPVGRIYALTGVQSPARLAMGGSSRLVWVVDVRRRLFRWLRRTRPHILEGHTSVVTALETARGGEWLASADGDGTVRIWDLNTGEHLRTYAGHSGGIRALAVDPGGGWLASGGQDGTLRIWDLESGELRTTFVGDEGGVAILWPDGGYHVEGSPRGVWWAAGLCRIEAEEIDEIAGYVAAWRQGSG